MNFIDTRIQPSVMFNAQLFLQPKCVPHTEHRMFRLRRTTIDRDCLGTSPCGGRDSSVGIATRYGLDGPGIEFWWRRKFSAPVQTGPVAHPASCTMDTGSFPGVKGPGCGADHPPPSKCRGHDRVELYLYSPSGSSWPVTGKAFTFTFTASCKWSIILVLFSANLSKNSKCCTNLTQIPPVWVTLNHA